MGVTFRYLLESLRPRHKETQDIKKYEKSLLTKYVKDFHIDEQFLPKIDLPFIFQNCKKKISKDGFLFFTLFFLNLFFTFCFFTFFFLTFFFFTFFLHFLGFPTFYWKSCKELSTALCIKQYSSSDIEVIIFLLLNFLNLIPHRKKHSQELAKLFVF